jgi:oligopeptide transport system permease protein
MTDPYAAAATTSTPTEPVVAPRSTTETAVGRERPRSLARDAWDDLRRKPIFWVSLVLMTLFVLMAAFPGLFTSQDPYANDACHLELSRQPPSSDAWFGRDLQGCDIYTRTIYGARASILVGAFATLVAMMLGSATGVVAGFFGGWLDALVSRVIDIFFAIPLLLGAILILTSFPNNPGTSRTVATAKVAVAIAVLGWTITARIMRSSVIQVKEADFVQAARALGAGNWRIIRSHVLPNSLTPVIVITTLSLGGYIGAEATLSYLGIGLQPPVISWGIAISDAQTYIRTSPHLIFFPGVFLALAVLSFLMFGDAVREALDPKLR